MKTLLALIVVLALAGGGYYWYTQNMAAAPTPSTSDPFGTEQMNHNTGGIPDGAVMEDGTLPEPADESPSTGTRPSTNPGTPGTAASAVKEFSVTNQGFNFSPKAITVKKGDRVKITYTNGGGTHDYRIDGYNVGTKVLSAGKTETIEFVADKVGTFESFCSVGNHRQMGMVGTFTVTE